MDTRTNTEFDFQGINHLAPACHDMQETVDFYSGVLGMPLIYTTEAGGGGDQVFFFDVGNGTCLAFMWSPDYPAAAPGIASPKTFLEDNYLRDRADDDMRDLIEERPTTKGTAIGSMNHIALNVAPDKIEEYRDKLISKGIRVSPVVNHGSEPTDSSRGYVTPDGLDDPRLFMRSIYFRDPNGIQLEIACWNRAMEESEASLAPARAGSVERTLSYSGKS